MDAAGPFQRFDAPATVDALLAHARDLGVERLDAQVLLAHGLGQSRTWLRAHGEHRADIAAVQRFVSDCEHRLAGSPVAYLTGEREFYGLHLRITADVLDPRPDTEVLVDWALACLQGPLSSVAQPRVADLGTGSGAVALAICQHAPHAHVLAVDNSPAALAVAVGNGQALGLAVEWRLGEWLQPLNDKRGHLLVSNPPYICETDPHLAALRAEPRAALVAGADGLDALRHIVQAATGWLLPGGWLLLEHGYEQAEAVAGLLTCAGFMGIAHRHDLAGHLRCTGGCWPG